MFTGLVEVFKDITGYEGQYQIGNRGSVKSLARHPRGKAVNSKIEPKIRLSIEDINQIITFKKEGKALKTVSEKFNCDTSQIRRITRGESRNNKYQGGLL